MGDWKSMESAPIGGGAASVTDRNWLEPPRILLLFGKDYNYIVSVGYWDAYYAEGGRGYEGGLAWIEPLTGERLDLNYDQPIAWMELPKPTPAQQQIDKTKEILKGRIV